MFTGLCACVHTYIHIIVVGELVTPVVKDVIELKAVSQAQVDADRELILRLVNGTADEATRSSQIVAAVEDPQLEETAAHRFRVGRWRAGS